MEDERGVNPADDFIRLQNVRLSYGSGARETPVFEQLDLTARAGESLVIIGRSGCGKTSILYALSGLLKPKRGQVTVGGQPVVRPRRDVALILQDAGLLPWKTVWGNAILGLQIAGEQPQRVGEVLSDLGISALRDRYPSELSGGQRQRVGIARALAADPTLLLMDEPLASLDAFTREHIQNLLLDLWLRRRHTQVLVTHDLEEAVFLGQRIVVLAADPPRIESVIDNPGAGTPDWRDSDAFYAQVLKLRKVFL